MFVVNRLLTLGIAFFVFFQFFRFAEIIWMRRIANPQEFEIVLSVFIVLALAGIIENLLMFFLIKHNARKSGGVFGEMLKNDPLNYKASFIVCNFFFAAIGSLVGVFLFSDKNDEKIIGALGFTLCVFYFLVSIVKDIRAIKSKKTF